LQRGARGSRAIPLHASCVHHVSYHQFSERMFGTQVANSAKPRGLDERFDSSFHPSRGRLSWNFKKFMLISSIDFNLDKLLE
jgi:hypothetical protein